MGARHRLDLPTPRHHHHHHLHRQHLLDGNHRSTSNILLAIKHDYAAAILAGTKTVELRSYLPRNLHPGDTIYLVGQGRIWGHCTFAGAVAAPPPGACRER